MQTCLELYQGQDRLRALDNQHRLARFLAHAAKTGSTPQDCKAVLLTLAVAPDHPYAAPVRLRCPYGVMPQVVHVDTSRLPADHGRIERARSQAADPAVVDAARHEAHASGAVVRLMGTLRRIERMAEAGEYGVAAAAREAMGQVDALAAHVVALVEAEA